MKRLFMLFLMISVIVAGLLWLYIKLPEIQQRPQKHARAKALYPESRRQKGEERLPGKILSRLEPAASRRRVAIIIDDIGYSLSSVKDLIEINAPLTFAILPHCPYSVSSAEDLHRAKREILLHIPMEPLSYHHANPGKGVLLVGMSKDELINKLDEDIRAVPYVTGVNNHMGSRFMADEEDLAVIMSEIRKRHLFFVDSRTTGDTKGEKVAKMIGLPYLSRRIFIDNDQDRDATLRILLNLASGDEKDPVVVIGHPYRSTIHALKEAVPRLNRGGVDIVPVSHLLSGERDAS